MFFLYNYFDYYFGLFTTKIIIYHIFDIFVCILLLNKKIYLIINLYIHLFI